MDLFRTKDRASLEYEKHCKISVLYLLVDYSRSKTQTKHLLQVALASES